MPNDIRTLNEPFFKRDGLFQDIIGCQIGELGSVNLIKSKGKVRIDLKH